MAHRAVGPSLAEVIGEVEQGRGDLCLSERGYPPITRRALRALKARLHAWRSLEGGHASDVNGLTMFAQYLRGHGAFCIGPAMYPKSSGHHESNAVIEMSIRSPYEWKRRPICEPP